MALFSTRLITSKMPFLFLAALFLATTVLGCGSKDPEPRAPPTGKIGLVAAPDFSAVDLRGVPFRLSDHRGKVVLINFFATWCAPCLIEMPHLRKIYEANKDKGFLLVVVSAEGVSATADVRAFGIRHQLDFPLILDEDLRISALFNPKKAAPLTVLINRSSQIAIVRDGFNSGDEVVLAEDVASLVARPMAGASN